MAPQLLMNFTWLGQPFSKIWDTEEESTTAFELTAWILDILRQCPHNDSRALIDSKVGDDNNIKVIRLFQRKKYRSNKHEDCLGSFKTKTPQQTYALAMYLLCDNMSIDKCDCCTHVKCTGPGEECVLPEGGLVGGACTNCYYSNRGSSCSHAIAHKLKEDLEYFKTEEPFNGFKQKHLDDAQEEELKGWLQIIEEELEDREVKAPPTPHKGATPSRKRKA